MPTTTGWNHIWRRISTFMNLRLHRSFFVFECMYCKMAYLLNVEKSQKVFFFHLHKKDHFFGVCLQTSNFSSFWRRKRWKLPPVRKNCSFRKDFIPYCSIAQMADLTKNRSTKKSYIPPPQKSFRITIMGMKLMKVCQRHNGVNFFLKLHFRLDLAMFAWHISSHFSPTYDKMSWKWRSKKIMQL